jgi:hypothetical protein
MEAASNISMQYKIVGLFSDRKLDTINQLDSDSLKEKPIIVALNTLTLDHDPKVVEAAKQKLEIVYLKA